jgi:hypothetical protein
MYTSRYLNPYHTSWGNYVMTSKDVISIKKQNEKNVKKIIISNIKFKKHHCRSKAIKKFLSKGIPKLVLVSTKR